MLNDLPAQIHYVLDEPLEVSGVRLDFSVVGMSELVGAGLLPILRFQMSVWRKKLANITSNRKNFLLAKLQDDFERIFNCVVEIVALLVQQTEEQDSLKIRCMLAIDAVNRLSRL